MASEKSPGRFIVSYSPANRLGRSGKGVASPQSPPIRTGRAPFRRIRLKHETTHNHARGEPHWPGGPPARYANRAGSRIASVAAAAPAKNVTVPPTSPHCCLTPVGCPLPCVHTKGKSAQGERIKIYVYYRVGLDRDKCTGIRSLRISPVFRRIAWLLSLTWARSRSISLL